MLQCNIHVSDHKEFRFVNVACCLLKLYHMYRYMSLKGWVDGRGEANGSCETGQLTLSIGPEWRDAVTLALKATPQVRDFTFGNPTYKILYIVYYCIILYIVFSSAG